MKQLNNIRQFSVILLLLSLLPLCVQAQTTESKEYTIVNNVDDLSNGDHIIIVSKYSTAMIGKVNTNSKSQRLLSTEITLNADKTLAYTNSDAACFTLVKTNDKFNFRSNEGKFINNVSEKNDSKDINLSDEISENTQATISFTKKYGDARILFEKNHPKYLNYVQDSRWFGFIESPSLGGPDVVYIYKLSSEIITKTKTRMLFGEDAKNTYDVTYGTTDFASPKANVYADNTIIADAKISYTSSNTDIATVDNDGKVTINNTNKYGETTITAAYSGDDNHYPCNASYTIKVNEKQKIATKLSFEEVDRQTIVVKVNEENKFTGAKAILSPVENGKITYSSSNDNVAKVDNEGNIHLNKIGETVISANYAGNETYAASSTFYRLQYRGESIVFASNYNSFNSLKDKYTTADLNFVDSISNKDYKWKVYEGKRTRQDKSLIQLDNRGGSLTSPEIDAPNGYNVTVLYYQEYTPGSTKVLEIKANNKNIESVFEKYGEEKQTNGTGFKVTAKIPQTSNFRIIPGRVAYISRIQIDINPIFNITLKESADNSQIIYAHKGEIINAQLERTLVADKWNTFCIPFNLSVADGKLCDVEAEVREYDRIEGDVLMFKESKEIVAGRPYLIRPKGKDINLERFFNSVRLTGPELEKSGDESFYMIGTYSNRTFSEEESSQYLFLNANAEFKHPKPGTTMKGMRAYFYCSPDVQASQMKVGFTDNSTDIKDIEQNNMQANSQRIYTINGSYVGTDKSLLPKGIYIINGKKYIK
ncbi:Ig-like domain-containing protein [Prevotella sp. 885]|uniref:Ig-like domain-containing protein n=1 Tax=Prevotella sp. 885 TaxID=2022527 RepID=UPI00159579EC|nr:Ig-like domain-containing protein [Prevotella sp. 885]